jgi:hypothetical protein
MMPYYTFTITATRLANMPQHTLQRSLISTLQYSVPMTSASGWRMWHYHADWPIGGRCELGCEYSLAYYSFLDSPTPRCMGSLSCMTCTITVVSPPPFSLILIPDAASLERSIAHIPDLDILLHATNTVSDRSRARGRTSIKAGFGMQATSPVDVL